MEKFLETPDVLTKLLWQMSKTAMSTMVVIIDVRILLNLIFFCLLYSQSSHLYYDVLCVSLVYLLFNNISLNPNPLAKINLQNKDFTGLDNTLPPLLVKIHGGPTAQTSNNLSLKIQYFTSRGFGILDVDYRGSTGYGKIYRHRLRGK